ncbi:MAG: hypothetical protein R3C56_04010 [Pirellulaceae bacterium]
MKETIESTGISAGIIVVSGTPTSLEMARHHDVEVGAGTTVLWDTGQPKICPEMNFQNAAVLISRVISHPTPDRICVDLGHKAVASEFDHPRVTFFGLDAASAVMHSEEHLVLAVDDAKTFPVGTVLYGLPRTSAPRWHCTNMRGAFAKVAHGNLADHCEGAMPDNLNSPQRFGDAAGEPVPDARRRLV